jgi:hypothetical protein
MSNFDLWWSNFCVQYQIAPDVWMAAGLICLIVSAIFAFRVPWRPRGKLTVRAH